MKDSIKWWLVLVSCSCALFVLVPLSLAVVWLTKKARAGEDRAGIELLYAGANQRITRITRITRGRKGTRK